MGKPPAEVTSPVTWEFDAEAVSLSFLGGNNLLPGEDPGEQAHWRLEILDKDGCGIECLVDGFHLSDVVGDSGVNGEPDAGTLGRQARATGWKPTATLGFPGHPPLAVAALGVELQEGEADGPEGVLVLTCESPDGLAAEEWRVSLGGMAWASLCSSAAKETSTPWFKDLEEAMSPSAARGIPEQGL